MIVLEFDEYSAYLRNATGYLYNDSGYLLKGHTLSRLVCLLGEEWYIDHSWSRVGPWVYVDMKLFVSKKNRRKYHEALH